MLTTSITGTIVGGAAAIAARFGVGFKIKVNPQDLYNESDALKHQIDGLNRLLEQMYSKVEATSHYWQGDASQKYRNDFKQFRGETDQAIRRLSEHVGDLNTIAGTYEGVEKSNQDIANQLSSDVIL